MITFADHTMLDGLAELRRICFDEEETYTRFYFAERFTPDNTLACTEQGRAVASLTLLPVTIATSAGSFGAAYVYAVATLPAFRRRGFAGALLERADEVMRARGAEALLLAPASDDLGDYYARFGYRPCFYRRNILFDGATGHVPTLHAGVEPLTAANYLRLRNRAYAPGGYFVQWDETALHYAIAECVASGGMARLLHVGADEGFFVAYPHCGGVVVKESLLSKQLLPYAIHRLRLFFGEAKRIYFHQSLRAPEGDWTAVHGDTEHVAMLTCLTPAADPPGDALPSFGLPLD
jgi:ribosomal protein S18 acetylase RimI-like enzyme